MIDFSKKLFVIGASSDIGIGYIKKYCSDYDLIVGHYLHMNENLEKLQNEIGSKLVLLKADLLNMNEVQEMIDYMKNNNLIPNHILHLPCVRLKLNKFEKITDKEFLDEFNISLFSFVKILREFLPTMAKEKFGRILVMLSDVIIGEAPGGISQYVMCKYALLGLVKSLASEYGKKGIAVSGISPGMVDTKFILEQPEIIINQRIENSVHKRLLTVLEVIEEIDKVFKSNSEEVNGKNIVVYQ